MSDFPVLTGMQLISKKVLGTATGSIDFPSIPQQFDHLCVMFSGRSDAGVNNVDLLIRFNGDSVTSHDSQWVEGAGATASAGDSLSVAGQGKIGVITGDSPAASTLAGHATIWVPNYSSSAWDKVAMSKNVYQIGSLTGNLHVREHYVTYRGGFGVVSRLTFFGSGGGNLKTGTRALLYGI